MTQKSTVSAMVATRAEWAGKMVGVYGFVKAVHIHRNFGISMRQAAGDIATFPVQFPTKFKFDPIINGLIKP